MKNPPIALLSDFGNRDAYAAVLKGVILSIHPDARVVDLCHGIRPFDLLGASLALSSAYPYFPAGSIFVVIVDPGVGTSRKIICAKAHGRIFIGPDNGVLEPVLAGARDLAVREVSNPEFFLGSRPSDTFHGRDIMAPAAARLARGAAFARIGPTVSKILELDIPESRREGRCFRGQILAFDHFGNALTNIRKSDSPPPFWKDARVFVKGRPAGAVRRNYQQAAGLFALFNSSGLLELAVSSGSARDVCRLEAGDPVLVRGTH